MNATVAADTGTTYTQLSPASLIQKAIANGEGTLAKIWAISWTNSVVVDAAIKGTLVQ